MDNNFITSQPQLIIHTDGGSRGNPGPAATGIVISSADGKTIHEFGRFLGKATNNVAEYTAVIDALNWVLATTTAPYPALIFKLDSQLVVEQLSRNWRIKDEGLKQLAQQVWSLISQNNLHISFAYVPRAENTKADFQVNLTLDGVVNN